MHRWLILTLVLFSALTFGQVVKFQTGPLILGTKQNSGTELLQLNSTTLGFLPPRMNAGQVTTYEALPPSQGSIIFNTTDNELQVWNGASFLSAGGGGISAWITGFDYKIGNVVHESNKIYLALTDHTSGTFATDLGNNEWVELSAIDFTNNPVTGVLAIANGGTNSSTALVDDRVMISSTGAIVHSPTIDTTELGYLDGVTSSIQTQLDAKLDDFVSVNDNRLTRTDVNGQAIQESLVSVDDAGVMSGATQLDVDNLRLDGNTVSSTDTNGAVNIIPNGSGDVNVEADSLIFSQNGSSVDAMEITRVSIFPPNFDWMGIFTPSQTTATQRSLGFLAGSGGAVDAQTGRVDIGTGTVTGTSGNSGLLKLSTGDSPVSSGAMELATGSGGATSSGLVLVQSGTTAGNSGKVTIATGGSTSSGDTGDIELSIGSTSGARGSILLKDGSEGTVGHVWTSTGTNGEGEWQATANIFDQTLNTTDNVTFNTVTATTSLTTDLINIGTDAIIDNPFGRLELQTTDQAADSENTTLTTGDSSGGATGQLNLRTGNASTTSGDILLLPGTGATRGDIKFQDGSEGTVGHVWTSTGVNGEGNWAAPSGAGGGNNLNLVPDFSFESGVTEGTCTGCTASQETSVILATENNAASLKMAFSAASGDYTDTITTSAQFTNVSSKVSAWIKTSASDCHLVEMVDGAESQTVAISNEDEWKLYELYGTTGTTSYGYRVECNTSITDDVYVDELYAGPVTEPIFDVAQAQFYASNKWIGTVNCLWSTSSAAFVNYGADADCDNNAREIEGMYNSSNGDVGNADGQLPQIKLSYMPAGTYKFVAKGFFQGIGTNELCAFRFSDGTNASSPQTVWGDTDGNGVPVLMGEIHYDTPQTSETTIQIQTGYDSAVSTCDINNAVASVRGLEISVYHYPSPQKVFASKCDGLECENTFSAKVSSSGVVSDENVDWINGNCTMSSGNSTCTFQTSLFGVAPNCTSNNNDGNSRVTLTAAESTSSVSTYIRLTTTAAAADSAYILTCQRAGSDYNQFDQRFVPVVDEEARVAHATGANISATADTKLDLTDVYDPSGIIDDTTNERIDIDKTGQYKLCAGGNVGFGVSNWVSMTYRLNGGGGVGIGILGPTSSSGITLYPCTMVEFSAGDYVEIYAQSGSTGTFSAVKVSIELVREDKTAFIGNLTPTEFVQTPGSVKPVVYSLKFGGATMGVNNCTSSPCTIHTEKSDWVDSVTRSTTGTYTVNFTSGAFSEVPVCTCSSFSHGITGRMACGSYVITTSTMVLNTADTGNNMQDTENNIICHGVQ